MPHVWLARGCPSLPPDARRVGARCVRSSQSVAGVRCCGGSTCVSVCLSQQSCDGDDGHTATLVQARAYCERRGRRLCTRAELGRGFCCKSGCAMDGMLVWTEDACTATPDNSGLPAAEQWPPPRGTGRWLSRAARCLGLSASNLSLHYPADADAHFLEMRRQLRPWTQGARPHRYAGYSGPWLEGRWISHFEQEYEAAKARGGRLRDVFGPWVPILVPWTDLIVSEGAGRRRALFAALRSAMRPGVPYITLVQHDEGLDSREQTDGARLGYL